MSWEETSAEQHPCPCGHGVFTIRRRMDDWGRSKEHWEMNCGRCAKTYTLHAFTYYRHGLRQAGCRWVPSGIFKQAQSLRKKARQHQARALEIAKRRYLKMWLSSFEDQCKKAAWARLTSSG